MSKKAKQGIELHPAYCGVCATELRPLYVVYRRSLSGLAFDSLICARCAKSYQRAVKRTVHAEDEHRVYTWSDKK